MESDNYCITDMLGMGSNFSRQRANDIYNMEGHTQTELEANFNENEARHKIIMTRDPYQLCSPTYLFELSNDDLKFDPKKVHSDWMLNVGMTTDCDQEWKESKNSSNENIECSNTNTVDK